MFYFNINKPQRFFFLQNTSCIRKPGGAGGVRTPCTLPLDPPQYQSPAELAKGFLKKRNWYMEYL